MFVVDYNGDCDDNDKNHDSEGDNDSRLMILTVTMAMVELGLNWLLNVISDRSSRGREGC